MGTGRVLYRLANALALTFFEFCRVATGSRTVPDGRPVASERRAPREAHLGIEVVPHDRAVDARALSDPRCNSDSGRVCPVKRWREQAVGILRLRP